MESTGQGTWQGGELPGSKFLALALCTCVVSSKAGESWSDKFCRRDKITQDNKTRDSFWDRISKKSTNLGVMWRRQMGNDDSVFLSVQDPWGTQWKLWSRKTEISKSNFCHNLYKLLNYGTHCHWPWPMSTKTRFKNRLGNSGLSVTKTRWPEWISGQTKSGSFNTLWKKSHVANGMKWYCLY